MQAQILDAEDFEVLELGMLRVSEASEVPAIETMLVLVLRAEPSDGELWEFRNEAFRSTSD